MGLVGDVAGRAVEPWVGVSPVPHAIVAAGEWNELRDGVLALTLFRRFVLRCFAFLPLRNGPVLSRSPSRELWPGFTDYRGS